MARDRTHPSALRSVLKDASGPMVSSCRRNMLPTAGGDDADEVKNDGRLIRLRVVAGPDAEGFDVGVGH